VAYGNTGNDENNFTQEKVLKIHAELSTSILRSYDFNPNAMSAEFYMLAGNRFGYGCYNVIYIQFKVNRSRLCAASDHPNLIGIE